MLTGEFQLGNIKQQQAAHPAVASSGSGCDSSNAALVPH